MDLNSKQKRVMVFIQEWCATHQDPVPQFMIIYSLKSEIPESTIKSSLLALKRKGYIRKAINVKPVSFVKLRGVVIYN